MHDFAKQHWSLGFVNVWFYYANKVIIIWSIILDQIRLERQSLTYLGTRMAKQNMRTGNNTGWILTSIYGPLCAASLADWCKVHVSHVSCRYINLVSQCVVPMRSVTLGSACSTSTSSDTLGGTPRIERHWDGQSFSRRLTQTALGSSTAAPRH